MQLLAAPERGTYVVVAVPEKEASMDLTTRFNRFDPFEEIVPLRNKVDRLFNKFFEIEEQPMLTTAKWAPVADILETKDAYIVRAELPGVEEKDLNIEIENGVLTLKGERKFEAKTEEKDFHRIERNYGQFMRTFTLPQNVYTDKITAAYVNGLIEVIVPKKEEAKPKKIHLEIKKKLAAA
jgi:HSP20 family protein